MISSKVRQQNRVFPCINQANNKQGVEFPRQKLQYPLAENTEDIMHDMIYYTMPENNNFNDA